MLTTQYAFQLLRRYGFYALMTLSSVVTAYLNYASSKEQRTIVAPSEMTLEERILQCRRDFVEEHSSWDDHHFHVKDISESAIAVCDALYRIEAPRPKS